MLHETPPPFVALGAILAVAAGWDLATARIPNWLTLSAAAGALAWRAAEGGWKGLLLGVAGALAGVALLLLPWVLGGLGAGDAKLLGVVGAFLGPRGCLTAFLGTALVGFVAALALLAWQGLLGTAARRWLRMGAGLGLGHPSYETPSAAERGPRLRYGLAIALGTIGTLLAGDRLPGPLSLTPPF